MQRCKFLGLDQGKLVDKVNEVFEAGVEMRLSGEEHDVLEVRVVDMCVDTEQTLKDHLDDCLEVAWKGHSKGTGEDLFVIKLVFYPSHQEVNVFASRNLQRCLHVMPIGPQVLVLWTS